MNIFLRATKLLGNRVTKLRIFTPQKTYQTSVNDDGSKEVRIPVPWGHIAGKEWGPETGKPVLAVHGWQDNAGSFDRLAPLLSPDLRILAIDLPGHGLSSHIPQGLFTHYMDSAVCIHRVVQFMGWEKFIYLGHSLGSIIGYIYCSTMPELVTHYIGIEALKPGVVPANKLVKYNRRNIEKFLSMEKKVQQPSYTYEEAVEKMVNGYFGSITPDSCRILLKRGLKPGPDGNGFMYSRDHRVKFGKLDLGYTDETVIGYAQNLRCEVLNIKGKDGLDYEPRETYMAAIEALKSTASRVEFMEVEGSHHLHLNTPEVVAPLINQFILPVGCQMQQVCQ